MEAELKLQRSKSPRQIFEDRLRAAAAADDADDDPHLQAAQALGDAGVVGDAVELAAPVRQVHEVLAGRAGR